MTPDPERPEQVETRPEAVSAGAPRERLLFAYDSGSRRFRKEVQRWNATSSTFVTHQALLFAYEGWNLLGELSETTLSPVRLYQWGLDLSGTGQGAGGVGGLLLMKAAAGSGGGSLSSFFYSFDGNGNVGQLVEGTSGATVADYEYGPFGETLRATGQMAASNPFRFSTHYADQETGILYAKRRYYATQTGGWLSRDPIGEEGGINLYGYVGNSPVNRTDPLGLAWYNPGDTDYILNFDYALRSWLSPIWNTDMTAADEQAVTIANAECTYRNSPMRGFVIGVRGRSPLGNGYDNSVGFSGNLALSWTMDSGFTGAGGAGLNLQGSTASGSGNFYGYAYNEEKGGSFARGLTLSSDRARVSGGLSHGVFSPNITLGLNLGRFGYAGVVVDTSKLKVW